MNRDEDMNRINEAGGYLLAALLLAPTAWGSFELMRSVWNYLREGVWYHPTVFDIGARLGWFPMVDWIGLQNILERTPLFLACLGVSITIAAIALALND